MNIQLKDLPLGASFLDPQTQIRFELVCDHLGPDVGTVVAEAGDGDEKIILSDDGTSDHRYFAAGDTFRFDAAFEVDECEVEYPMCECPEKCIERFAAVEPGLFRKAFAALEVSDEA